MKLKLMVYNISVYQKGICMDKIKKLISEKEVKERVNVLAKELYS